jgi:hypothetical protein
VYVPGVEVAVQRGLPGAAAGCTARARGHGRPITLTTLRCEACWSGGAELARP